MKPREMIVHLNLIRALAMFFVLVGHARNIFLDNYSDSYSLFVKIFIFFSGFATQMVMIFFVLSGFCITSSILYDLKNGKWAWSNYLINRSVRVYIGLIPALFLTLFWDHLGVLFSHNSAIYQGLGPQNVVPIDVLKNTNFSIFFGNLFLLQHAFTSHLGSNGPLWRLPFEYWYYIVFPLSFLIFFESSVLSKKIIYAIFLVTIVSVFWVFIYLFPVWLLGSALAFMPRSDYLKEKYFFWIFLFIAFISLLICMVFVRFNVTDGLLANYSVGMATSFLIYVLLHDIPNSQGYYAKIVTFFANMSYTVYLTHMPFLIFLYAVFVGVDRWPFDEVHAIKFIGVILLAMFYAYLVSRFTEAKTPKVKEFLYSNFLNKKTGAVILT